MNGDVVEVPDYQVEDAYGSLTIYRADGTVIYVDRGFGRWVRP